jgi:cytochrome c551/c552
MNKWKAVAVVVFVGALGVWWAMRPGAMRHPMPPLPQKLDPAVVAAVGRDYARDVQPLMKRACFNCHSKDTVWPWYHAIPGVRQYIEGHVEEGREDLDLTDGFPFNTDVPLLKHLRRIAGQVQRGDMPLWDYKLMHPEARLSDAERQVIVRWAQDGFDRLTSTAKDAANPGAPMRAPAEEMGRQHRHEGGA